MRHDINFVDGKARCRNCLRYAASTALFHNLYPACIEPKKRRTRLARVLFLDYGSNERGTRVIQLWDKQCAEFLLRCGGGRYTCPCRQYHRDQMFPLPGVKKTVKAVVG